MEVNEITLEDVSRMVDQSLVSPMARAKLSLLALDPSKVVCLGEAHYQWGWVTTKSVIMQDSQDRYFLPSLPLESVFSPLLLEHVMKTIEEQGIEEFHGIFVITAQDYLDQMKEGKQSVSVLLMGE